MSGSIDLASLCTHLKAGSDLKKVYPDKEITEQMILEASFIDSWRLNLDEKTTELIDEKKREELLEQVNLKIYDILNDPVKYAKTWKTLGITEEEAAKQIEAYHKKFGVPDMSKLKE